MFYFRWILKIPISMHYRVVLKLLLTLRFYLFIINKINICNNKGKIMKKIALLTSMITIAMSYAFLYFGNIYQSFHAVILSKILGITFEISLIISTILFIIIFIKKNKLYLSLTIVSFLIFLVHILLILFIGFQKPYSYAMDVAISLIYTVIISQNWDLFLGKKE